MTLERPAIVAADGVVSYPELDRASRRVAGALLTMARREGAPDDPNDLAEARVAFHIPPGVTWVAVRDGIWRAGGIAVPLAMSHPAAELEYTIGDSGAAIIVAAPS